MSKLHVTQIGGYLKKALLNAIKLDDIKNKDAEHLEKAFLTRALGVLAVAQLTDMKMEDLCPFITDGFQDGGIDLIFYDAKQSTLFLVQTKWHSEGNGSIDLGDTLKFIEGVKRVLDNELTGLNDRVRARQLDIERALYDASAKFVLVLAHTGQEDLGKEVDAAITTFVDSQNDTSELMSVRIFKQKELHKAVAAGVVGAPISMEVQLSSWGQIRDPHYAIYGQVSASDVAAWMTGNGQRLFESNLRHFLSTTAVNQDIVRTLLEYPEDFWYYNNGITAVSTGIAKKPIGGNSTDSGIFECEGFCVVNGAQTVGSIHAANQQSPDAVAKAMVPVRIISSANSGQGFSTEVTRCTNTQNAIEKRDFVALDPEQERIRQELQIEGVGYTYKAGSASSATGPKFDLTEATVSLACAGADVGLAVQAKREISKLWEAIDKTPYKQLFNSGVTGPMVWRAVQILRAVDQHLQTLAKKHSGRDALICVHGNRFIHWAAIRKLKVEFGDAFTADDPKIETVVKEVVSRVIDSVKNQYADSYPASLFKNLSKCRALAQQII